MGLEQYRRSVKESKRASILAAAQENFLKNGFSRAAVAEIAREADVSTATLYKHFSSKEELFATVVRESYGEVGEEFGAIPATGTAREILYRLARAYLKAQYEHQVVGLMRIVIAEVPTAPEVAKDAYNYITMRRHEQLTHIFDLMVDRKMLKPHDTNLGTYLIAGMIKEKLIWPALFDATFNLPDNADEVIYEAIDIYLARYAT